MLKAEAIAPALGIMWLQMQSDRDDIEQLTQQNNVLKRQLDEYREELGRLTEETSRLQGADSAHMDEGGPGRDASGDAAAPWCLVPSPR